VTASELIESVRSGAVIFEGRVLLPPPVAMGFLAGCEREEVRLLGVDAFFPPSNGGLRGPLQDSLDFSGKEFWDYSVPELCELARELVMSFDEERVFEFAVDE
jgi:hypothetical protein